MSAVRRGFAARLTALMLLGAGLGLGSAAQAQQAARLPLPLPQAKELYQRVLTLPGAKLESSPNAGGGSALSVFSIFYVYGKQGDWLEVGRDLRRGPEGWVRADQTQNWSVMMTMQYAPPGQRGRVLFFERQQDLRDLVGAVSPAPMVRKLEAAVDAGQQAEMPLASIEPSDVRGSQQPNGAFYLMPIVGFSPATFDDGRSAMLLNISLVNANPPPPAPPPPPSIQQMNGAIVFVLDTTISMKPYFQRAAQSIRNVLGQLKASGLDRKIGVGIVAYRNNMDQEPQKSGLGYVVKVIQPLDPNASLDQVMAAVDQLEEAKASSHSFNEDAVAGLWTAIEQLDWAPFENQSKMIFLVTDAGALAGNDPKAKFQGVDIVNVVEAANRKNIAINPLHIASAGARKLDNLAAAGRQYRLLASTVEPNANRYQLIDPATPAQFDKFMTGYERGLVPTIEAWAKNSRVERPQFDPKDDETERYRKIIVNEMFNAQQRYIGVAAKTQSKTIFNAWAADRDLTDPNRLALGVSVYLTRTQLSQLALSAKHIYDTAKSQEISSDTMFRLLQSLSAQTAQDPNRFKGDSKTVSEMGILPSFLSLLPYKSEFLNMTPRAWAEKTPDAQAAMLATLAYKIRAYQAMNADTGKWKDLGAGDDGQKVMPVPLEYLP